MILERLESAGHKAYIVGGAVRDILLSKTPKDYDITTSAHPQTIIDIFKDEDLYLSGLKHGTVTVILDKKSYEITTFRKDGVYRDHRHPTSVTFGEDVLDDLKRRDLTINAILMDAKGRISDPLNAKKDLDDHIIRTVGDPEKRFEEDALRIMRTIRFRATLGFTIEAKTESALYLKAPLLNEIAAERKADEFLKIVKSDHVIVLKEYQKILTQYLNYTYFKDLDKTDDLAIRLALLFKDDHDELKKLFLNKKMLQAITFLCKHKDSEDLLLTFGEAFDPFTYIEYIRILKGVDLRPFYEENHDYIANENTLKISSFELADLGYKGKDIGLIKKELLKAIRAQKVKNDHDCLYSYLVKML